MSPDERLVVVETMRALRERGWPAGKALQFVADQSFDPELDSELDAVGDALERGEEPMSDDPLVRILARGEEAGPNALREASRGLALQAESQGLGLQVLFMAVALLGIVVALSFLIPHVLGVFQKMYAEYGADLPALTQLVVGGAHFWAIFFPVVVALGGGVLIYAFVAGRLPWLAGLRAASDLRVFAAAMEAGMEEDDAAALIGGRHGFLDAPGVRLDRHERVLASYLIDVAGPARAARELAAEKEASSRSGWTLLVHLLPGIGILALMLTVGTAVIAVYLPIFTLSSVI